MTNKTENVSPLLVVGLDRKVRPPLGEMRPFEWMRWEAMDFGATKLAEACEFLRGAYNCAIDGQNWQTSRRMEVEAELDRLRRYLETIRDTGMNAEEAVRETVQAPAELLMRARECVEWHVGDGDECGIHARAVMADIEALLGLTQR